MTATEAKRALDIAREHLIGLRSTEGWWQAELETNVTIDAEDLLLREFLGIRTREDTAETARWIRSRQRADGTWVNFHDGPGEPSTTIEAYTALRLAGDPPDAAHMRAAAGFARDRGGIEASRTLTRVWLALFGQWSWDRLPALPPEMIFLPARFPLNVHGWACWARRTIVPLTIAASYFPVRALPFDLAELRAGQSATAFGRPLDRALHRYERRPLAGLRHAALRRATEWIVARQEPGPPWPYALIALRLRGYELDHPVMRRGIGELDRCVIRDEKGRRPQACRSPVWDTALAVNALHDAGLPGDHPAVIGAAEWLLSQEVTGPGDWAVHRPWLAPGGWASGRPCTDGTAMVILALRRVRHPRVRPAIDRGLRWMTGMASRDGGFAAFDADTARARPPFAEIDPPSADITAHVVEALAGERHAPGAMRRAVVWLLRAQEADGSWLGRWGVARVYGVGAVVPALVAAGVRPDQPCVRRAVAWLENHQNDDGGWGEDPRSHDDPAWIGRGDSTASQTSWALLALLAAGERSAAVERGVRWLVEHQRPDGTWDEPQYTSGGVLHLNNHLYRLVFPISVLGRYVEVPS